MLKTIVHDCINIKYLCIYLYIYICLITLLIFFLIIIIIPNEILHSTKIRKKLSGFFFCPLGNPMVTNSPTRSAAKLDPSITIRTSIGSQVRGKGEQTKETFLVYIV